MTQGAWSCLFDLKILSVVDFTFDIWICWKTESAQLIKSEACTHGGFSFKHGCAIL